MHQGERILSVPDNAALISAVRGLGRQPAPQVNVRADVYIDGKRVIDDRVKVVINDMTTETQIAGAR